MQIRFILFYFVILNVNLFDTSEPKMQQLTPGTFIVTSMYSCRSMTLWVSYSFFSTKCPCLPEPDHLPWTGPGRCQRMVCWQGSEEVEISWLLLCSWQRLPTISKAPINRFYERGWHWSSLCVLVKARKPTGF